MSSLLKLTLSDGLARSLLARLFVGHQIRRPELALSKLLVEGVVVVDILSLAAEHGAVARHFPLRTERGLGLRDVTAGTPLGATTLRGRGLTA